METTEVVKITNDGNADGQFKWESLSNVFLVSPKEGVVSAYGGSVDITLTYRPSA
jgi:hypothetical protein